MISLVPQLLRLNSPQTASSREHVLVKTLGAKPSDGAEAHFFTQMETLAKIKPHWNLAR